MAEVSEWKFRGEGNAFLVLVNEEEKKVYRLAKSKHWGKGHLATCAQKKADIIHEEMQLVVDYMKNVMQPILSPYFVVLPELRILEERLTEEAELQIRASRPGQRKGKEVDHFTLDPATKSALVMPDLCYMRDSSVYPKCSAPTLSVEIKPKKAFMHVPDSKVEEKTQVCKFCMHQRLKAKEGQWPVTSRYCPLDLFSGNRARMKQALLALAETPQNNLRICQDGEEIHGAWNQEDMSEVLATFFSSSHNGISNGLHKAHRLIQTFLDLVLEALLFVPGDDDYLPFELSPSVPNTVQYCQNSRCRPDKTNDCDECVLPTGCVLERIFSTQKLDTLDIEHIFPVYLKLSKYLSESPTLRQKLRMDGPYCDGDWLQACSENSSSDDDDDLIIEKSSSVQSMVNMVKRFLISKTVQDCSIMVALQRVPDNFNEDTGGQILKDPLGQMFRFSVTIVDLDPKPFCKIPAYHKQDLQIVSAYREACGGEFSDSTSNT